MKFTFSKAMRGALSLLLALCLVAGMCPMAFAASTDSGTGESFLDYDKEELSAKLLAFLQDFWPKVDESVLRRDPVEYVAKEDSFYVALGDASAVGDGSYVDLMADELGIPALNLADADMKLVDETYAIIEKNADEIAKADLISLGFSAHVFMSNAIYQAANQVMGSEEYIQIDWVALLGEAYAADVEVLLEDMRTSLGEQGVSPKLSEQIVSIVETCAFSATVYAVHLPELIATIREYNADAAIVVVGMYNPMENISVEMDGAELDMTSYMEMVLEAAEDHASDCCATTPDAAFVSASKVETQGEADGEKIVLKVDNLFNIAMQASRIIKSMVPSASGHTYVKNRIMQQVVPIYRVAGANRFETSFLVADQLKASLDVKRFDTIIVASGTNFADALSGSYLSTVKGAPILLSFSTDTINAMVVDYVAKNLAEDGQVYILGGTAAVPESLDAQLMAYAGAVTRLAGENRFETNLKILREAGVGQEEILICTGTDYADSLAASATGKPILLVYKSLYETQKEYLESLNGQNDLCVIGGTSAVSQQLEDSLDVYGKTNRVYGTNRINTSVEIAKEFFSNTEKMVVATGWEFADGLCGGALAYSLNAPLMLTLEKFETPIAEYATENRIDEGIVLGGQNAVSDAAADASFGK